MKTDISRLSRSTFDHEATATDDAHDPMPTRQVAAASSHNNNQGPLSNLRPRGQVSAAKRPYFEITKAAEDEIHALRQEIAAPKPKHYGGLDAINQMLRHVASAAFNEAERAGSDMIEVQCSVFDGKIHISSNFHSDKIPDAIRRALVNPREETRHRPIDTRNWTDIADSRRNRHIDKLRRRVHEPNDRFALFRQQVLEEAREQPVYGIPGEEVARQTGEMLDSLRKALSELANGNDEFLVVHRPLAGGNAEKIEDGTTHAEQNIEASLASDTGKFARAPDVKFRILIPMAGGYVACVTCNEVEHIAKTGKSGLFNDDAAFALHRSSMRVGRAYSGEKQYIAFEVMNPDRAAALKMAGDMTGEFRKGGAGTYSAKKAPVPDIFSDFDTDSESDIDS